MLQIPRSRMNPDWNGCLVIGWSQVVQCRCSLKLHCTCQIFATPLNKSAIATCVTCIKIQSKYIHLNDSSSWANYLTNQFHCANWFHVASAANRICVWIYRFLRIFITMFFSKYDNASLKVVWLESIRIGIGRFSEFICGRVSCENLTTAANQITAQHRIVITLWQGTCTDLIHWGKFEGFTCWTLGLAVYKCGC